ncbi:MAG: hypothetical protein ACYSSN_06305 [Planctomycetota bacterium]|jgi:hypothetical protein
MKVIEISDELYDRLKTFVVDPFDDTPEIVLGRVVDIVDKAKSKWISWDAEAEAEQKVEPQPRSSKRSRSGSGQEHVGVAL